MIYSSFNGLTGEIYDGPLAAELHRRLSYAWQMPTRVVSVERMLALTARAHSSGAQRSTETPHVVVWNVSGSCETPGRQRVAMRGSPGVVDDLLVVAVLGGYHHQLEIVIPCGSCDACLARRRAQLETRALNEVVAASHSFLATFTFNGATLRRLREAARELLPQEERQASIWSDVFVAAERRAAMQLWAKFRHRVRKFAGVTLQYQCVVERGEKRGRPHLHAVIHQERGDGKKPLPLAFLRAEWATFARGRRLKRKDVNGIRRIANHKEAMRSGHYFPAGRVDFRRQVPGGMRSPNAKKASGYVSKYLGKSGTRICTSVFYGRPLERPELLRLRAEKLANARAKREASRGVADFVSKVISAFGEAVELERPRVDRFDDFELVDRVVVKRRFNGGLPAKRSHRDKLPPDITEVDFNWLARRVDAVGRRRLLPEEYAVKRARAALDNIQGLAAHEDVEWRLPEVDEIREAWRERALELHDSGAVQLTDEELGYLDGGHDVDESPPF